MNLVKARVISRLVIIAGLLASAPAYAVPNFFMTATGQKQGKFPKEETTPDAAQPNAIPLESFAETITMPIDSRSGLPTGMRQHAPITINKRWGAASPHFLNALVTNERLTTVEFFMYAPATGGSAGTGIPPKLAYTIKLTNANVIAIKHSASATVNANNVVGIPQEVEEISFTYQKIDFTDVPTNTVVADDWTTPG